MKSFIIILLLLSFSFSSDGVYMIGYVPPYRIASLDEMDMSVLTHVIAAFANPDSSGTMSCPIDLESFSAKVKAGGSSPVISIGGGGSYSWGADTTIYSHLYADSNRTMFVNKLVEYAKEFGVSGIDVDIEGTPLMHPNYDIFVQELADSLHANDLEVYSAFGVGAFAGAGYVDDETLLKFDIIGTMSYGGVGNWNWQKQEDQATVSRFKADVQYFIDRGVDPKKIAGGVPFYSVGYPNEKQSNYSAYFHTLEQLYSDDFYWNQNPFYNDTLTNNENNPEYCNSFPSMKKKIKHMFDLQGGIMIWELGQDNFSGSGPRMLDSMAVYIKELNAEAIEPVVVTKSKGSLSVADKSIQVFQNTNYSLYLTDMKGRSLWSAEHCHAGITLHSLPTLAQGVYQLQIISVTGHRESVRFVR